MKKVKQVDFGLENCELLSIEGKYIGNFFVDDIKQRISKHYDSISHMNIANHFSIMINAEADQEYDQFGIEEYKANTFERLAQGDICSVDIVYDDDSKDEFYVRWAGESEYKNAAQSSYKNHQGDLFILVKEGGEVEKEFENWDTDSESFTHLMWDKLNT